MRFSIRCLSTWWTYLLALRVIATALDHTWLLHDNRIPSWDQAEYLSNAIDHGRALGLLQPGSWNGWAALLDLSPKIPPLSSLISGSMMAAVGETSDQAIWIISAWHGVLLITTALWGRSIGGSRQGLLSSTLVAVAPAMAEHRVEFMLDMPLTGMTTLTLWLLYRWQRPDPAGGRWGQAIAASTAIAASLLIKQSALLVVALPAIWSSWQAMKSRQRRVQVVTGGALVIGALVPWLHHNWITTIGGTQRAVLISGAEEGDPGLLNPESWWWYPRLWPSQLGAIPLITGLAGWLLPGRDALRRHQGLLWLLGTTIAGWIMTSISPNKDARYIAPILPLIILLMAQGWMQLFRWILRQRQSSLAPLSLFTLLAISTGMTIAERSRAIQPRAGSPAQSIIRSLRERTNDQPTTLLLTASDRHLNEQNLTYLGQLHGGQIQARRLGRSPGQGELARDQGNWWVLVTGDQGTSRQSAQQLSHAVREDSRFQKVETWPWRNGQNIELWQRKNSAGASQSFDQRFIRLARGMQDGPRGVAAVFDAIHVWHLLDPEFTYQKEVEQWALKNLAINPDDRDALWSLSLLKILNNRPQQADQWLQQLERLDDKGNWASTYRMIVNLADWDGCSAARIGQNALAQKRHSDSQDLIKALYDISQTGCFNPLAAFSLSNSLPKALASVERALKKQ